MYSKSLAEADRSTERYMVMDMQRQLEKKDELIAQKDAEIAQMAQERDASIAERDASIAQKDAEIARMKELIRQLQSQNPGSES